MIRRPPRSTRTDTLFPYTTLFRSESFPLSDSFQGTYADSGLPLALLTPGTPAYQAIVDGGNPGRSEEHTSELQSLMRISYAVFCLKKKTQKKRQSKSNTWTPSEATIRRSHDSNNHTQRLTRQ